MKYEVKSDPPLTRKGIQQAIETGQYLKEALLKEHQIEEIVIECSPLLRTMMTASIFAKELGLSKIMVNFACHEHLDPDFYQIDPMPTLVMKNRPHQEIISEYLNGIEFEIKEENYGFYPEDMAACQERAQFCYDDFSQRYLNNNKRIAHLCVSHGALVDKFACIGGGKSFLVGYCGISAYSVTGQ